MKYKVLYKMNGSCSKQCKWTQSINLLYVINVLVVELFSISKDRSGWIITDYDRDVTFPRLQQSFVLCAKKQMLPC